MAKREKREIVIPDTSVLSDFVRRGNEGICISCRKGIREHYGRRGVWVGCRAPEVPATATFVLVPVILPADRPMVTGERHGRASAADHTRQSVGSVAVSTRGRSQVQPVKASPGDAHPQPLRFVYAPKDRRTKELVGASDAVQDAYKGLLRASKPVDAVQAAKLAKRPTEANRRCLNWLAERGLAVKATV